MLIGFSLLEKVKIVGRYYVHIVYDLPNCPISDSFSCPKSDRFSVQRCGYAPGAYAPGSVISLLAGQASLMRKRRQLHFHS